MATGGVLAARVELDKSSVLPVTPLRLIWSTSKPWRPSQAMAGKTMSAVRFAAAIDDLEDLTIDRYPTLRFMHSAYQLRESVTA